MRFRLFPGKRDNKLIYYCTILLSAVSIVMVASASVGLASQETNAVWINMSRQVVYFIAGYLCMMLFYYNFNIKRLRYLLPTAAFFLSLLLLATLFFEPINGARAWLRFLNFSFQPSEFVKAFVIIYIAVQFPRFYQTKISLGEIIRRPAAVFAFWTIVIVFLQHDWGTAAVIVLIVFVCLLLVRGNTFRPLKFWTKIFLWGGALALVMLMTPLGVAIVRILPIAEYQKMRFIAVVDPFMDIYDKTYQLFNSLVAFGRGKWTGVGFGNSHQKFGYLPEARTDFILPIIVEELGIVGLFALVLIPYLLLINQLFRSALKNNHDGYKIILIGTIGYFFVHFLLNVGGVSAFLPMTGIPLLLVSSGGSSTICAMSLLGVCQNIINRRKESFDEGD